MAGNASVTAELNSYIFFRFLSAAENVCATTELNCYTFFSFLSMADNVSQKIFTYSFVPYPRQKTLVIKLLLILLFFIHGRECLANKFICFLLYYRLPSPFICNCTSNKFVYGTLGKYGTKLLDMVQAHPLPNSYLLTRVAVCHNITTYKMYAFVYHYIPAAIMDCFLWILRKKFR